MLKLGCTIQNLANIRLNKYTVTEFYPFLEADIDLLEKSRENVAGCHSFAFSRKANVDETFS